MSTCIYLAMFNLLEMPATSVPMGFDKQGLPIGIQVIYSCQFFRNNSTLSIEDSNINIPTPFFTRARILFNIIFIVQVVATKNNDRLTLAVAKELEKGFGGWALPLREMDKTTVKSKTMMAESQGRSNQLADISHRTLITYYLQDLRVTITLFKF